MSESVLTGKPVSTLNSFGIAPSVYFSLLKGMIIVQGFDETGDG